MTREDLTTRETAPDTTTDTATEDQADPGPLYPRLLRLQSLQLGALARALLVEGVAVVAVVLVLADVASAWTLVALPLAVTAMVKLNDVVETAIRGSTAARRVEIEETWQV
jgi:hypothetical protein